MKGRLYSFIVFLLSSLSFLHAQDVITQLNGDELPAKIMEITLTEVKYKKFSNPAGPTYVMPMSEIFMIKYEDGSKDLFETDGATNTITLRHIAIEKREENQKEAKEPQKDENTGNKINTAEKPKAISKSEANPTDAKEQFLLGLAYEKGDGVAKDQQKAADWYSKAAEQGYAEAQYHLALLCSTEQQLRITTKEDFTMRNGAFRNSEGLTVGPATARYWWRKAAEQGHAGAKAKLKETETKNQSPPKEAVKTKEMNEVKGNETSIQVKFESRTFTVSIGKINKNDKRETTVELLIPEVGEGIPQKNGQVIYPVLANIIANGDTIHPYSYGIQRDDKNMTFSFPTSLDPEKIIVLHIENNKYTKCAVFDAKTKKVQQSIFAAPSGNTSRQANNTQTGEQDIVDLIENNLIEVDVQGSDITAINLRVRKLASYPVDVNIPVGSYFVAANSSSQNMVATAAKKIRLTTDGWQNVSIPVACANRPKNIPDSNDRFTVKRSPHLIELTALMPVLEKANAWTTTKQAAVWIVTDDASYSDLGILISNGQTRAIGPEETAHAMKICSEAGIDITSRRIWKDRQMILDKLSDGSVKEWLKNR